jgi:hypothetical protein
LSTVTHRQGLRTHWTHRLKNHGSEELGRAELGESLPAVFAKGRVAARRGRSHCTRGANRQPEQFVISIEGVTWPGRVISGLMMGIFTQGLARYRGCSLPRRHSTQLGQRVGRGISRDVNVSACFCDLIYKIQKPGSHEHLDPLPQIRN